MAKRTYIKEKSQDGGLHDQMNCLSAFMRGYMGKEASSEKRIIQVRANYKSGHNQWQIGQIELACQEWGLTFPEAFILGEYLYAYCPSYQGREEDYIRLQRFGATVKSLGLGPMKAMEVASIEQLKSDIEALQARAKALGISLKIEINYNQED